jgi:hypothetical protein
VESRVPAGLVLRLRGDLGLRLAPTFGLGHVGHGRDHEAHTRGGSPRPVLRDAPDGGRSGAPHVLITNDDGIDDPGLVALAGLPGVAFSAARSAEGEPDYTAATRLAKPVLQHFRSAGLPALGQLLKVENPHPAARARGIVITRMSTAPEKEDVYVETAGPGGERLFLSRRTQVARDIPGTDVEAVAQGFVAVTPLSLDQTEYDQLSALMAIPWSLMGAAAEPTRER